MCIQWLASCLIAQRTIPFHIHSISTRERELSIQFHIESILDGVRVRHYSALNGGLANPECALSFLIQWYIHSFILNSTRGSEMNGGRQTPNVHCLFLYRWYIHSFALNSARRS